MRSLQVKDIDLDTILDQHYDISVFASGYESRCVHLPGLIKTSMIANPLLFGFIEEKDSGKRQDNDFFFRSRWSLEAAPLSGEDDKPIFDRLNQRIKPSDQPLHLLVDYSSMSRLWYTAVLN